MSLLNSWLESLSKKQCVRRGNCSILGIKIAASAFIFLSLPTLIYLFAHEYHMEGYEEFIETVTYPPFWIINFVVFGLFMLVLSKLIILPLKRFALHIEALEEGRKKGEFQPGGKKRIDEIGFLVDRFNRLHRIVTNEIATRDVQLGVLHDYTSATSGILDIPALMETFFNTLKTSVDFKAGAFVLRYDKYMEGRVYCVAPGADANELAEFSKNTIDKARQYNAELAISDAFILDHMSIGPATARPVGATAATSGERYSIDLPICCGGETIGVVVLYSYSLDNTEQTLVTTVFSSMVQHTNVVLERLLSHLLGEQKKLSKILESLAEGVYLVDEKGYATSINGKGLQLVNVFCKYGMECAKNGFLHGIGSCKQGSPCAFSGIINKIRNTGHLFDGSVLTEEIKKDDGTIVELNITGLDLTQDGQNGYVITARDVTEERLLQKRVMLTSKLTALGEMAAGIAHEINNPLQVMMANVELLEDAVSDKGKKRLDNMKEGIFRVKGIVKDLLIFAREQTTNVEEMEVGAMLRKAHDIMVHQLRSASVSIALELDPAHLNVRCNKNLFQQVIINLLQNAKDAIEESGKGTTVRIRTRALPDRSAFIEVSDDGPGIPPEIREKIFDPFFTTKDVGKGTGLGLSVSRRIIEGMGGTLTVASQKDGGTAFTVILPLVTKVAIAKPKVLDAPAMTYECLSDKDILIVDDEEGMGIAVKEVLAPKVADVEVALDGKKAYELLMERDFDIILLDVKMPGMGGMELYKKLKEEKPYLTERIIFLTGDTLASDTESFMKLTGSVCLSKPFSVGELKDVMRNYVAGGMNA